MVGSRLSLIVLSCALPLAAQFAPLGNASDYTYLFEKNSREYSAGIWRGGASQGKVRLSVLTVVHAADTVKYTIASSCSTLFPPVTTDTLRYWFVDGSSYREDITDMPWPAYLFPNLVPPGSNTYNTISNVDTLPCFYTGGEPRLLRTEGITSGFPWAMYFEDRTGLVYHQSSYGITTLQVDYRAELVEVDGIAFSAGTCIGLLYRPITITQVSRVSERLGNKHTGALSVREYDLQGKSISATYSHSTKCGRVRVRQVGPNASLQLR